MRSPDYSFEELKSRIHDAVMAKPQEHNYARTEDMSTIGG
jgi:hypothetical protein